MKSRLRFGVLLLAVSAGGGCGGGGSSPTQNNCRDISGSWNVVLFNSCNQTQAGAIMVTQQGCSFSSQVAGLGTLSGSISGSTVTFSVAQVGSCPGSVNGTATLSSNAASIVGTYSGHLSCCDPVSGSFTLTR